MKKQILLSLTIATLASPSFACGYDFFRIHDLDFLNDSHGFRILNDGLQETHDGGQKWTSLRVDGEPKDRAFNYRTYTEMDIAGGSLFLLSPPNHKGMAKLHISHNEGRRWESVELAEGMRPLHIDFVSARQGFVQLDDNRLLVTDDGAQTWMEVAKAPKGLQVTQLSMSDAQNGFVLAMMPRDGKYFYLLLTTENGGHDWKVRELENSEDGYFQLQGIDGGKAIVHSGHKVLMADLAGGPLKEVFVTTENKYVNRVLFRDAMTGVVSTYDNTTGEGQVLFTQDGGVTFTPVPDFLLDYEYAWAFAPNSLKVVSLQDFFLEVPAAQ